MDIETHYNDIEILARQWLEATLPAEREGELRRFATAVVSDPDKYRELDAATMATLEAIAAIEIFGETELKALEDAMPVNLEERIAASVHAAAVAERRKRIGAMRRKALFWWSAASVCALLVVAAWNAQSLRSFPDSNDMAGRDNRDTAYVERTGSADPEVQVAKELSEVKVTHEGERRDESAHVAVGSGKRCRHLVTAIPDNEKKIVEGLKYAPEEMQMPEEVPTPEEITKAGQMVDETLRMISNSIKGSLEISDYGLTQISQSIEEAGMTIYETQRDLKCAVLEKMPYAVDMEGIPDVAFVDPMGQ